MPLPVLPPTMMFWHNGHMPTARLRGLALYRAMLDEETDSDLDFQGIFSHYEDCDGSQEPIRVWVSSRPPDPYSVTPGSLIRVINPGSAEVVDYLEHISTLHGAVIIVDVTHPVDTPSSITTLEQDPLLQQLDREATASYWMPGREPHTQLVRAMRLADAVSVPNFPRTLADARRHSPAVVILPDLGDDASVEMCDAFSDALGEVVRVAMTRGRERILGEVDRG